jgi:hypothetical protein
MRKTPNRPLEVERTIVFDPTPVKDTATLFKRLFFMENQRFRRSAEKAHRQNPVRSPATLRRGFS